jgi:hypothetical protein
LVSKSNLKSNIMLGHFLGLADTCTSSTISSEEGT